MYIRILLYLSEAATYYINTCSGVQSRHLKYINISDSKISKEITIKSPGYPWKNYESNTIYMWILTAPELTEEINIRIELDVHYIPGYPCEDYLKIQDNFAFFNRYGNLKENRTARGNKLIITLYSNYDVLTAKGFQLHLKVWKISTRSTITTTLATTTLPLSKTSVTSVETKTTKITSTKNSFPQKTKSRIMSEILSSAPATLYSSLPPRPSTAEIFENLKTTHIIITTDIQHMINSEIPNSSSTTLSAVTSTESTPLILSQEMVILMVGVGIVELTIIIVGILAVRRHRQEQNSTTRPNKAYDRRPVSRKTVCSVDNVYAIIPDETCDENPYKDLSEGVYDTTSKRRSHVNCSWNESSKGSFYSRLFRGSNNDRRRPIEENLPMS